MTQWWWQQRMDFSSRCVLVVYQHRGCCRELKAWSSALPVEMSRGSGASTDNSAFFCWLSQMLLGRLYQVLTLDRCCLKEWKSSKLRNSLSSWGLAVLQSRTTWAHSPTPEACVHKLILPSATAQSWCPRIVMGRACFCLDSLRSSGAETKWLTLNAVAVTAARPHVSHTRGGKRTPKTTSPPFLPLYGQVGSQIGVFGLWCSDIPSTCWMCFSILAKSDAGDGLIFSASSRMHFKRQSSPSGFALVTSLEGQGSDVH